MLQGGGADCCGNDVLPDRRVLPARSSLLLSGPKQSALLAQPPCYHLPADSVEVQAADIADPPSNIQEAEGGDLQSNDNDMAKSASASPSRPPGPDMVQLLHMSRAHHCSGCCCCTLTLCLLLGGCPAAAADDPHTTTASYPCLPPSAQPACTYEHLSCVAVLEGQSWVTDEVGQAVSTAQQASLGVVGKALLSAVHGGLQGQRRCRLRVVLLGHTHARNTQGSSEFVRGGFRCDDVARDAAAAVDPLLRLLSC